MEWMDEESAFFHYQHTQWSRSQKNDMYCNVADVTNQRLHDYLHAMEIPRELVEQLQERMQESDSNAFQAFGRLRLLLSGFGQETKGLIPIVDVDASAILRLCTWFEPGQIECIPCITRLFNTPPIHRISMVPEAWDE